MIFPNSRNKPGNQSNLWQTQIQIQQPNLISIKSRKTRNKTQNQEQTQNKSKPRTVQVNPELFFMFYGKEDENLPRKLK